MKKIFFLLILPFSLQAQKNYPVLIDQYMHAAVNINQFSGSVLVAKHNDIIYQKVFGTSDYASTKLLDSNSMFELGDITEGTLWMTIHGEPDLKLLPESPAKFFSSDKEYDWQIVFNTGNNGSVEKTYFIFNGLKKEAKRL